MKNIRLVGRLVLLRKGDTFEGVRLMFNPPPVREMVERFNAIVAIGSGDDAKISSIEIIFVDRWREVYISSGLDLDDGVTTELGR